MAKKMNRSEIMSRIRSKETGPERKLRKALWAAGIRGYRKNWPKVIGKPDLAWPGRKVAVFVDGCFWHCCPTHFRFPKTRSNWWQEKLSNNIQRDGKTTRELQNLGWVVLRFWEHESTDIIVSQIIGVLTNRK